LAGSTTDRFHQPAPRECALLILRLLQARLEEQKHRGERDVTRARISQATIRRLCGRSQVPPELLVDIQEFLLAAGWCLFCIGPSYFGIIKLKNVEGWPRISSGRIGRELIDVAKGKGDYVFTKVDGLLLGRAQQQEAALLARGSEAEDADE